MEGANAIAEQKIVDLQRAQSQATVLFEEEAALRQKLGESFSWLVFLLYPIDLLLYVTFSLSTLWLYF